MKNKGIAAFLAFFIGTFGIHRFYLGQTGLGIFYCLIAAGFFMAEPVIFGMGITTLIGLIDGIVLLSMDKEAFDRKYNYKGIKKSRKKTTNYERQRKRDEAIWEKRERREEMIRQRRQKQEESRMERAKKMKEKVAYKEEGVKRFKDYDYDGAIAYFEKVLEIEPSDIASHFNLSCAYSLNENTEKALFHLDKAVAYGFNQFEKIKTHDALAYLRVQAEYQVFQANNFRLSTQQQSRTTTATEIPIETPKPKGLERPAKDLLNSQPDLLDQLQKLGELRDRGLLTDDEFTKEKRKLLSQ